MMASSETAATHDHSGAPLLLIPDVERLEPSCVGPAQDGRMPCEPARGSEWITAASRKRLEAVSKDVASLSDYETRLSDKIQLLLDAVLGFINIQQNEMFKVLTIVSVVGVPPTILVGVWGMNFKNMPELSWTFGYPLSLLAIIAGGVLPLIWFKRRGWFE
jgi:magnesium transporter